MNASSFTNFNFTFPGFLFHKKQTLDKTRDTVDKSQFQMR